MSRFTVSIEMLAYPKGELTTVLEEEYTNWTKADRAFCAYRDLTRLEESRIKHVQLIEHRDTFVCKEASKGVTVEHNPSVLCLPRRA